MPPPAAAEPYQHAITIDVGTSSEATEVAGFSVRHSSPSIAQNYAVYAKAGRTTLRDMDVSSSSGSGVGVEGGDLSLVNSKVHDCKNHGVLFVGEGTRGAVRGCTLARCKLHGVLVRDGAAPLLADSTFDSNGLFGVAQIDCAGQLAESNVFRGNAKGRVSGECDRES